VYEGDFNASAECWGLFTEVLGAEFQNAVIFGQVHQLSVDTYAVQHAGGAQPDKSVAIHLSGLHLALERGIPSPLIPPRLQRIAATSRSWPRFEPPPELAPVTVWDIAYADGVDGHVAASRSWARAVWAAWAPHHDAVAKYVADRLGAER
jgi:hypothetical protein